jgi:2-oxoglutarate dehydrogenase E2 component (dihydrolipoamide succinyltransferase)
MTIDIIVPSPGESITQVQVAKWLVEDGAPVEKDQEIVEIDSDKATFPLTSPVDGTIKIRVKEGETIAVGTVVAGVEEGDRVTRLESDKETKSQSDKETKLQSDREIKQVPVAADRVSASPLAKKIIEEKQIPAAELATAFGGKKITRKDLESYIRNKKEATAAIVFGGTRDEERKKLTTLRMKLAERLVSVKNQTAMLTTFNEVNMQKVLKVREKYGEAFKQKYGIGLGFMSFFTKAAVIALKEFPQVNSMIDGDELVIPRYVDVGIAVSAPKGLVVPVVRNAETLSFREIEAKIKELSVKARENRITIDDMKGGTFTITNGGVFGSLMSTPILNPPQSAILGMHKIMDRPIAVDGRVEIAPMMYLALSYDHRVIDGRESVSFLVRIKELIEDPIRILTEGEDPLSLMLDL